MSTTTSPNGSSPQPAPPATTPVPVSPATAPDVPFFEKLARLGQRFTKLLGPLGPSSPATPSSALDGASLQDLAISADMKVEDIVRILADATGDTAEVIAGIEEDKEVLIGQVVNKVYIFACYLVPALIAWVVGVAIGQHFAGGAAFNPLDGRVAMLYIMGLVFEYGTVITSLALVRVVKRMQSGLSNLRAVLVTLVIFLFLAGAGAVASWSIYEASVNTANLIDFANALARSLGVPVLDLACANFLAVMTRKTLDQQLHEMDKKTDAAIKTNGKKMEDRLRLIKAAISMKSELQKEADYQRKNELATEFIEISTTNSMDTLRTILEQYKMGKNGRSSSF